MKRLTAWAGHANTATVELEGRSFGVDTGFIVYNPRNYPNFVSLMDKLDVETAESDMSFGGIDRQWRVRVFVQSERALRPASQSRSPAHVADDRRHSASEPARARQPEHRDQPHPRRVSERERGYSRTFREDHILPMCAAIWSSPVDQMRGFPADSFFRFFLNHGLLQLTDRPQWRTIAGGSPGLCQSVGEGD